MFRETDPKRITDNPVKLIGADWMLVTAGIPGNFNTMTASWGGIGHLWELPVAWCFVRPIRYTFNFIERADYYTFSFFDEKHREVLNYCGDKSGKDVDKVAETGLTTALGLNNTIYFEEARLVLILRKLYSHLLEKNNFIDKRLIEEYIQQLGETN